MQNGSLWQQCEYKRLDLDKGRETARQFVLLAFLCKGPERIIRTHVRKKLVNHSASTVARHQFLIEVFSVKCPRTSGWGDETHRRGLLGCCSEHELCQNV